MLTPYAEKRYRRVLAGLYSFMTGGARADRIPARWARAPQLGTDEPVCIFVMLARDKRILPHSVDHARAWRDAGLRLVVVLIVDALDDAVDLAPIAFADAVLLRVNRGYDFGAWAAAIQKLAPSIYECPTLAIANDSVLGPSNNFAAIVRRAMQSTADVVGLVESNELARHLQSFMLVFNAKAVRSVAFRRFWSSVRTGERQYVIDNYEVPMRGRLEASGLTIEALFPIGDGPWHNPAIITWRTLVAAGFPYLKIELLRTAPWQVVLDGWRDHAAAHGFDMAQLDRQIEALERLSPTPWAYRSVEPG